MLLKHIKASRTPQEVSLSFDNGQKFPVSATDVVNLHLAVGQEFDSQQFETVANHAIRYLLLKYSLRQIALSPKTEALLLPKIRLCLKKIAYRYSLSSSSPDSLVGETLSYLHNHKLLEPADYASYLVHRSRHQSRLYLRYRMNLAGVKPGDYPNLAELHDDQENIRHFINRHPIDFSDPKARNRLIASLLRRGFAFPEVKSVIDDIAKNR